MSDAHFEQPRHKPHFEATFNLNPLFTAIPLALSLLGLVWWQSNFQSKTEERLTNAEKSQAVVEILAKNIIETKLDSTRQDLRITNNKENIDTIVTQITDLGNKMNSLNTSLQSLIAVLDDRKSNDRRMP